MTLLAGSLGCSAGARTPEQESPSILLITVDSLRADRVGYSGSRAAHTPSLDALAARSIRFRAAQSPSPLTTPALASLHTGAYPARHGLRLEERDTLGGSATTLAETLSAAGYRTGAVTGSLLLHPKYGLDQGFSDYWESFGDAPRPREIPVMGIVAARVVQRAMEWLETAHRERFFLWVNFHDPHYFYAPPPPFDRDYADQPYDGEVAYVDREVGRLLERLAHYGADSRTMIIVAGSHGEGLMDHGEAYHGTLLYQTTLHVPLLVKPAGAPLEGGADVEVPVSLVDLMPTVLDAAGLSSPSGLDGRSLAGALRPGGTLGLDAERPLLAETSLPTELFGWRSLAAVRSGRWKYISSGVSSRLYDLHEDPGETTDLFSQRPEVASRVAQLVAAQKPAGPAACEGCADIVRSLGLIWPAEVGPAGRDVDPESRIAVANDALKAHRTFQRKMVQGAMLLYEEVLEQDPDNRIALVELAWLTALGKKRPELGPSMRMLERAQRRYADEAMVYYLMGYMALVDPGDRQKAGTFFNLAARLDPLNEQALYDAACSEALAGRKSAALDLLARSIDAGFRDFSLMRRDKDLATIRAEARFAELVPAADAGAVKSGPAPAGPQDPSEK